MSKFWKGIIAVAVLFVGIVSLGYLGQSYNNSLVNEWLSRPLPPGKIITSEDGRYFVTEKGEGPIPVLIETGMGSPSVEWWPMQDQLAAFCQTMTYDRAGYGWSAEGKTPRTIQRITTELQHLLIKTGNNSPLVLVGHGLGALYVNAFARRFPQQVAGVIMLDPEIDLQRWQGRVDSDLLEDFIDRSSFINLTSIFARLGFTRTFKMIPYAPPAAVREHVLQHYSNPRAMVTAADEYRSAMQSGFAALDSLGAFPDVPLTVVYHSPLLNIRQMEYFKVDNEEAAQAEAVWQTLAKEYLDLSGQSRWVESKKSAHLLHLEDPQLVEDVVRDMLYLLENKQSGN